MPGLVARPRDGAGRGGDARRISSSASDAERGGDASCSCRQHVGGPARAPVQLDARVEQRLVGLVAAPRSSPSLSTGRAASAQRRAWTSRRPPRPSLRSGSSRKATSPTGHDVPRPHRRARRNRASTASATALAERLSQLRPTGRPVAGEVADREQRGGGVEVVGRQGERLVHGADRVAELQPVVPDRVPEASAMRLDVPSPRAGARGRDRCRGQLPPPVATDGDQSDAVTLLPFGFVESRRPPSRRRGRRPGQRRRSSTAQGAGRRGAGPVLGRANPAMGARLDRFGVGLTGADARAGRRR